MAEAGRILIADDEETFLVTTSTVLSREGYTVETVNNGHLALKCLQSEQFDLMVCDLEMPGNGDLKCIREAGSVAPGLPIILVTAHPSFNSAIQSVQLPVIAYLIKPLDPKELVEHVKRGIGESGIRRFLSVARQRTREYQTQLDQMQSAFKEGKPETQESLMSFYPYLAISNIQKSLVDLQHYTEAITRQQAGQDESNAALQPQMMHEALMETIRVLEKTKHSFRSKELGELRRRLEKLLSGQL